MPVLAGTLQLGVEMTNQRATLRSLAVLVTTLFAVMAMVLVTQPASANGGSDGPIPYVVGTDGISLPEGDVFPDNGHINVRLGSGKTVGVHFEGKCIDRSDAECAGDRHDHAQYIGKSFIPWSAMGVNIDKECVVWVQISHYNQHFGEGGQPPVGSCGVKPTPSPTPTPTATVDPTATPTPTVEPTVTPTPTVDPTSTPTATVDPTVTPTPTIEPTSTPTPTVEPTSTPTATVSPTVKPTASQSSSPTAKPTVKPSKRPTASRPGLPSSGA